MMNKYQSILIIEDDELYAAKLKQMLGKYAEQITIARSAENGSHFVSGLKPSIIFLDNKLPNVSGNDALELFKELSPDSKIILMSATWNVKEASLSIQKKADYMFDKLDFGDKELDALMKAIAQSDKEKRSLWRILNIFPSKTPNSKKMVIVEDDELFSFHLNYFITEEVLQAHVNSYSTGESFIKEIKTLNPDLIFLDHLLPDISGLEILNHIKTGAPQAKVIIISSQDDYKVPLEFKVMGVYGYIKKDSDWKQNVSSYLEELRIN